MIEGLMISMYRILKKLRPYNFSLTSLFSLAKQIFNFRFQAVHAASTFSDSGGPGSIIGAIDRAELW